MISMFFQLVMTGPGLGVYIQSTVCPKKAFYLKVLVR